MSAFHVAKRMSVLCALCGVATLSCAVVANATSSLGWGIATIFLGVVTGTTLLSIVISLLHVSSFAAATFWVGTAIIVVLANWMHPASDSDITALVNILYVGLVLCSTLICFVLRSKAESSTKPICSSIQDVKKRSCKPKGERSDLEQGSAAVPDFEDPTRVVSCVQVNAYTGPD